MAEQQGFVFVSYASEDRETVAALIKALEGRGVPLRSDLDFGPGDSWQARHREWTAAAAAVMVVWSKHSARSTWVASEAAAAADRLVSIALTGTDDIPAPFRDVQALDLSRWMGDPQDDRLDTLAEELLRRIGGGAVPSFTSDDGSIDAREPVEALPDVEYSASVRRARDDLVKLGSPITAAQLAAALQEHHPGYGGGTFEKVRLDTALGTRRPVEAWLADVARLYDLDRIAASRHQVVDGELLLAGLVELDPELRAMLDGGGFLEALRNDVEVGPRLPSAAPSVPAPEPFFEFSTDTPGPAGEIRASDDKLGIEDDVRTLCRLALARSTVPPLAIGLFGDWGTGKSFFMRRMQARVREMQAEAAGSLSAGGQSPYCDNVAQIAFNAWNYVDSNLWASLMTRIFEGLRSAATEKSRAFLFSQLESTRAGLEQARRDGAAASRELVAIGSERSRLEDARQVVRGESSKPVSDVVQLLKSPALPGDAAAPKIPDGVRTLAELREVAQDARSTARLLRRVLDNGWFRVLLVAAALAALGGLAVVAAGGQDLVARAVSTAVVVVPTVAGAASVAWRRFRDIVNVTSQAEELERWIDGQLAAIDEEERRLLRDRDEAQRRAQQAAARLRAVSSGDLVREYVESRITNDAYRDQLGVISLVREDLATLSALLSPTDDGPEAQAITARFDIQRIVLYIDDLDRCPPDRVVEVLQAVHLLLAFPGFVVVVGVDSRWLVTSLEIHYRRLLQGDADGPPTVGIDAGEWEATPADYLEKIFQIPLSLPPMNDEGYRALVGTLVPVRSTDGEVGAPTPPAAVASGTAVAPTALAGEPLEAKPPPAREVRSFEVEGTPLAVRFVLGGKRLVVATTAGVWVWNQGTSRPNREVSAPITDVRFSIGGEQLLCGIEDTWSALDLATRQQATPYLGPEKPRTVAAGQQTGELVFESSGLVWRTPTDSHTRPWTTRVEQLLITGDRVLVLSESAVHVLRVPDLATVQVLGDKVSDPVLTLAVDHRDETLYTLHSESVRVWRRGDEGWASRPSMSAPLDPRTSAPLSLIAGDGGVYVAESDGLRHVSRDRPAASQVLLNAPEVVRPPELSADPSGPMIVWWWEGTVVAARREGARLVETARLPVVGVEKAAVSPGGGLVATLEDGACRLWYVGGTFEDEEAVQLELDRKEAEFIASLGPVVPTARGTKRLVNVYRMLRASAVGRALLQDPDREEYKVALLLLSVVLGWPHLALVVLEELDKAKSGTWPELLDRVAGTATTVSRGPGRGDEDVNVLRALHRLSAGAPADLGRYRTWAPHVRRFSMLTRPPRLDAVTARAPRAPRRAGSPRGTSPSAGAK